ncbi:MAG: HD domain-containing protein [Oscillospiraceae bacterium]|jgi:HD-GYP domain-containing protein (c-di-GMP phosphodiesterase class II)|nr:HD domain-containing protein [Oscillospiraceae bacterium]
MADEANNNKDPLIKISISLLRDGVIVPHDINDLSGKVKLVAQGQPITFEQIEKIKRINKGEEFILVSQETHKLLLESKLQCKVNSKQKVEEETGYKEIKDEALTMLKEIGNTNTVSQDSVHAVSEELSNILEVAPPDVILDLVNALAPMDEYLQRHSTNVAFLNGLIGKWLDFPKDEVDTLVMIGLMHDCGKVAVPSGALNAPRRLAIAEFEVIKMHPIYSYNMLSDFPERVRRGARAHHEKYNGSGYVDGLTKRDIPIEARITAVSDIYDAMISRRVYKEPKNPFNIIVGLMGLCESELDPAVVEVFATNMPKELVGKPVMLSNGEVGVIHEIDLYDLEYPIIRTADQTFKSSNKLYCKYMYSEEDANS